MNNVYLVAGIRRSGIHAITYWILEHSPNACFLNSVAAFTPGARVDYHEIGDERHQVLRLKEVPERIHSKDTLACVFEDELLARIPDSLIWQQIKPTHKVLVLRDHYNLLASRLRADATRQPAVPPAVISRETIRLFCAYAEEYLSGIPSWRSLPGRTVAVLYNQWHHSAEYRATIAHALGLGEGACAPLSYITKFGSSFDPRTADPSSIRNLTRWEEYHGRPEFDHYADDSAAVHFSERLFGMRPFRASP